jgi:hypothetical protein
MASDETPRPRETEAPEGEAVSAFGARARPRRRRAGPPTPVRRGVTAALAMFAAAAVLVLATFLWALLSHATPDGKANAFFAVGMLIFVVSLFAAPAVSLALPPAARGPFWSTGFLCAFMLFILWGVTCGVSGAMSRVGG